jgi:hypothetical protein
MMPSLRPISSKALLAWFPFVNQDAAKEMLETVGFRKRTKMIHGHQDISVMLGFLGRLGPYLADLTHPRRKRFVTPLHGLLRSREAPFLSASRRCHWCSDFFFYHPQPRFLSFFSPFIGKLGMRQHKHPLYSLTGGAYRGQNCRSL